MINNNSLINKIIYTANYRGTKEMDILLGKFVNKYVQDLNDKDSLKNSEKVLIKPYDILIIPFGWKYLQEINNKTINYHIDVDNYFTFIHNIIINKI